MRLNSCVFLAAMTVQAMASEGTAQVVRTAAGADAAAITATLNQFRA